MPSSLPISVNEARSLKRTSIVVLSSRTRCAFLLIIELPVVFLLQCLYHMVGKLIVRCRDPQFTPHAHHRAGEHVHFRVPPRIQILQRGIARRSRTLLPKVDEVSALSKSIPFFSAIRSTLPAAGPAKMPHAHCHGRRLPASHHRLCLVVRHVEPEFAPDLREDDVCCTVVQPCIREKIIQRLNASGASAKIRLSIYNTDGRLRIKNH